MVVHGLHTPRDSEEAQPCTAKELQEVIRQLPADPRQWNYTYSIELSEYRELIRLFQQVEPGDILDELWNQLRFDYDSTTQQFTIMSAGALHAYITQHLNTQILHYIEACRKSGGLIQALAMMLGCSGDFPYDFSVKADPTTEVCSTWFTPQNMSCQRESSKAGFNKNIECIARINADNRPTDP